MIEGLSKEEQEEFDQAVKDPDLAVQKFFRIKNLSGEIVPFRYNRAQRLNAERGTKFDFVLKARKVGISSRRFARDLWICATQKGQHRIMLAQTGDQVEKLFSEKIKPLIDNCLISLGAVQRSEYIFFKDTGSRYYIGTAGSRKFGRGDDISGFHFSEYAHWDNPEVATGVEQALVEHADGLIETTANGHNFAKLDWDKAKRGESQYRAIFLPWYVHDGYSLNETLGPLSDVEGRLVSELHLSNNQIAWRRNKIKSMRDPSLFPQEYPESDQEAFISSGRPVFDWISLARAENLVSPPKWRGYLVRRHDRIELIDDPQGPLRVWKIPERGHVYAIGSDVAEGLEGGAYSTGEVLDIGDGEQVAEWHGHIAPDLLADVLQILSDWYNFSIIIPESWPGPGAITTVSLENIRARLWHGADSERNGWETTAKSKPMMVSAFVSAIRDRQFVPRSPELLEECHSFVYDAKGHMVPSAGNFSDRLMGMGIVWYCTRDLASRVDYYKAPRLNESSNSLRGSVSVPRFNGPRLGVRPE